MLIGNLTKDPEIKALPSGIKVCSFQIATNHVRVNDVGQKKESVEFHWIIVFGNQADACAQWLKKGQQAFVEGRLQTRSWEKTEGGKMYRTEIVADKVQFGQRPASSTEAGKAKQPTDDIVVDSDAQAPKNAKSSAGNGTGTIEYPTDEINPADIPF